MSRTDRISDYVNNIWPNVEGWVPDGTWHAIDAIGQIFKEDRTPGNFAEFGVHHGRFLFLIDCLRDSPYDEVFAVGIWDDPSLKFVTPGPGWDAMQASALQKFKDNAARFLPNSRFNVIETDTFNINTETFGYRDPSIKFLSIDAGHTPENAINDLCVGQDVLVPGGFIAFDDFMNPYWEGATQGVYKFMEQRNRRLRPVMFFRNKLYFTTISEHRDHLSRLELSMAALCDKRRMIGHECLVEKPK